MQFKIIWPVFYDLVHKYRKQSKAFQGMSPTGTVKWKINKVMTNSYKTFTILECRESESVCNFRFWCNIFKRLERWHMWIKQRNFNSWFSLKFKFTEIIAWFCYSKSCLVENRNVLNWIWYFVMSESLDWLIFIVVLVSSFISYIHWLEEFCCEQGCFRNTN